MSVKQEDEAEFTRFWTPMVGAGLLLGFGIQPLLPYISPHLPFFAAMSLSYLYNETHEIVVLGKRLSYVRFAFMIFAALILIFCFVFGLVQAANTLEELEEPCARWRAELFEQPNSATSDAYTALHCPTRTYISFRWLR